MEETFKYKLSLIGASDDGDRIFCMFKSNGKSLVRGMYDFSRETFVALNFQPINLQEGQTPEMVFNELSKTLMEDFDWEFKDKEKILTMINNGKKINAKRKKKKNGKTDKH